MHRIRSNGACVVECRPRYSKFDKRPWSYPLVCSCSQVALLIQPWQPRALYLCQPPCISNLFRLLPSNDDKTTLLIGEDSYLPLLSRQEISQNRKIPVLLLIERHVTAPIEPHPLHLRDSFEERVDPLVLRLILDAVDHQRWTRNIVQSIDDRPSLEGTCDVEFGCTEPMRK